VLELGSGTGGASAAVARAIAGTGRRDGIAFTVSDVSRSFLASAVARVRPLVPSVRSLRIDFDRPLDDQEIAAASVDVVVAVNALHNAADIPRTLDLIRAALSHGGVLVLSESLCGAGALVHQEFVFNLLGAPRHGARASRFLSADQWRQLLDDARLELAVQVNGRGPELAMLALGRRAD
jgi:SAM-dependent methyltransferase